MKCKRAYLKRPGYFELEERDLEVKSNQILVKIKLCGLCNWELNFWKGTGEADGYYRTYPWVLGHEWAGIVEEIGADVTNFKKGDKVTYLPAQEFGGFSEYAVVDEGDCFKLDDEVDLYNAMGEPLKCIVTVLKNAAPMVGDSGLVLGCGPMGLWCIQALKSNALGNLIAVDVDDAKLALARKYGATHTINPVKENAVEKIQEINRGELCDFVIEGTGNANLIPSCLDYLKIRGRLVLMSSYAKNVKEFDLTQIIDKCIKIYPAHPASTVDTADDMKRAIALINRGTFHNDDIITHRFTLEEINKAFTTLENKPKDYIKGIIEF